MGASSSKVIDEVKVKFDMRVFVRTAGRQRLWFMGGSFLKRAPLGMYGSPDPHECRESLLNSARKGRAEGA